MSSKFSEFLTSRKIDPRRVRAASAELERLRPEDRAVKLKKRQTKASGVVVEGGEKPPKPRSGRGVTPRALASALQGAPVPAPTKSRLLRAVNHVLAQKKADAVDLRALF